MSKKLDKNYSIQVRFGLHTASYCHRKLGTYPLGSVRISLNPFVTKKNIDYLREALKKNIMAKLVRDKIRKIILDKGKNPIGYFSNKKELKKLLAEKLVEEAKEFNEDHIEEELADVQEVIDAIYENFGFSRESIRNIQDKKRKERGGFEKGYVLEDVQ